MRYPLEHVSVEKFTFFTVVNQILPFSLSTFLHVDKEFDIIGHFTDVGNPKSQWISTKLCKSHLYMKGTKCNAKWHTIVKRNRIYICCEILLFKIKNQAVQKYSPLNTLWNRLLQHLQLQINYLLFIMQFDYTQMTSLLSLGQHLIIWTTSKDRRQVSLKEKGLNTFARATFQFI